MPECRKPRKPRDLILSERNVCMSASAERQNCAPTNAVQERAPELATTPPLTFLGPSAPRVAAVKELYSVRMWKMSRIFLVEFLATICPGNRRTKICAKKFAKISPHFSPVSCKIFARTSLCPNLSKCTKRYEHRCFWFGGMFVGSFAGTCADPFAGTCAEPFADMNVTPAHCELVAGYRSVLLRANPHH